MFEQYAEVPELTQSPFQLVFYKPPKHQFR